MPNSRAAESPACIGSVPISRFRLLVEPAKGGPALAVNEVNQLVPGQKLKYEPLHLPAAIKDKARVAVLLAPPVGAKSQHVEVLDAQPAKEAATWDVPIRARVVGVVFGPRGLSVKKVSSLVNQDDELIPELADYAHQTETVQALVQTLQQYEQSPSTGQNMNAALQGFANQYNVFVPKLDPSQPANEQASTLLRAVLPSLSSFDPLTSQRAATVQQTTGLAASVAALFFGTPVGLAAGGTALLTNLHTIVSPDTKFAAAFTQTAGNGLALCAKPVEKKSHSRTAYLWVLRVPDAAPPSVSITEKANLPLESKCTVEVSTAHPAQLKLLPRAREWRLASGGHEVSVPVKVDVGEGHDALNLDLTQAKLSPGEYHLAALWDWTPLEVKGAVELHRLGDFSGAHLAPESEDRLVSGAGTVNIELAGADFEFVHEVAILPAGDAHAAPKGLSFTLPKGEAQGEQLSFHVELDTTSLPAGTYLLRLTQAGGAAQKVNITIHPPNPTLAHLPLRVNLGETEQALELRGTGLERITGITSQGAQWKLSPVAASSHGLSSRRATVKLQSSAHKGDHLDASLTVEGMHKPLDLSDVLEVAGPLPKITDAKASFAQESDVALRPGEVPSGTPVSFAIHTENVDAPPSLSLACEDAGTMRRPVSLHPGDKDGDATLDFAGENLLFLSLDPGTIGQSGCVLAAAMTTPDAGTSAPYTLGRVMRLPRIEKFSLSDEKLGDGLYLGTLTGKDLQVIAKTGWTAEKGFPVAGIPVPLPGTTDDQTLRIGLSWPPPAPHAALYVWLRGETAGRKTTARY